MDTTYSNDARKTLRRMPTNRAATIIEKIEAYANTPACQANNVRKLHGVEGFRLRVGDCPVIYDIKGTELRIIDIGPRGSIYG